MKLQKQIIPLFASTTLLFVFTMFVAAEHSSGQQKQPSPQKGEMKSMGDMSMDKMMKECSEHHQSMTKSIDQMSKMMQDAKQSNDPVKMKSAIDQAQKQLTEMKEHMTMCTSMMNMMEKMQGMGGMKGSSK
jgi:hypothetical protein